MNNDNRALVYPVTPENMVLIPAGEFQMGSNNEKSFVPEQPVHTVHVDAFYMDTHLVTNLDFKRFVLANSQWQKDRIRNALHDGRYLRHWSDNNYPTGKANHPVTYVSWYAAVAYSKWVGKRLPTEAEWEKAARGGLEGRKYPWGNRIDPGKANYYGENVWYRVVTHRIFSENKANYYGENIWDTTPVGSYAPNGYGLYDMAGNVWEWCLDACDANFYFNSPSRNPLSGVNTLSNVDLILNDYTNVNYLRVLRGGSCYFIARYVRCASRGISPPSSTNAFTAGGFRCARAVTP